MPAGWDDLLRNDSNRCISPPTRATPPISRDEIPGTAASSEVRGPVVDQKVELLGGDQGHDGLGDGGSSGQGLGGTATNPLYGVTDPGPDSDQPVQSSGPQEPGHETFKHDTPGTSANAPQGDGTQASASQGNGTEASATADKPVETPALAAAHELQEAVAAGSSEHDPWGTRGRYADAMASPAGRAESAGEKAADKLLDAVSGHEDTPSQHRPIEAHEKMPEGIHGADLHDAGGVFAELIHAAENPLQSGFGATHQPAAADALQHLGLGAGVADHGFDGHAGEDVQPVSLHEAPLAALHDAQVEHYAAPVLDVTHLHFH